MQRKHFIELIDFQFGVHPIVALLGPRQAGKSTLAKMYIEQRVAQQAHFFDLENPIDLARLDNPMTVLANIVQPFIIIDEIQMRPDLFQILRVIVDRDKSKKFLILGSASRDLIRQSSETLAGRIGYIELTPFALYEVHDTTRLWLRGGFPRSYLAPTEAESYAWRTNYIATFLERDIPNLGFNIPAPQLRRFWLMLANTHGQLFNASEIGKSLMVSHNTVRSYLDILVGTFMIRSLQPWFENISKRQVKSPKIYFRDSGLLHALLGITDMAQLQTYPKLGSFWEGFALEEVARVLDLRTEECFFWATQAHAELDLFIFKQGKRIGFEFKYNEAPRTTKSMHSALNDLQLDHLAVIYPGNQIFALTENSKIQAYGIETIASGEFVKKLSNI